MRRARSRALRAASRAMAELAHLSVIFLAIGRVLLEELAERLVHRRLDDPLDLGVAELGLGLAFELRLGDAHVDDRRQPLAHVVARKRAGQVLEQPLGGAVVVDRARQGGLEPGEVRAALGRVDRVGVGEDLLLVALVVLHRDLDLDAVALALDVDGLRVQRLLVAVEIRDELDDAALVEEIVLLAVALVLEDDAQPLVEEGELAQALGERVEVVLENLEDLLVGEERDLRPRPLGLADLLDRGDRFAAAIALLVDMPAAADLDLEPLRQGVDHRNTDAVQAAGDFIARLVELAAGVQLGERNLGGRDLLRGMLLNRDAAAVVGHRHRIVGVHDDADLGPVTGQVLVDAVVDHLVDQVVQSGDAGAADVHRGALAHRLQPLEDLDVRGIVVGNFLPVLFVVLSHVDSSSPSVPSSSRLTSPGAAPRQPSKNAATHRIRPPTG